MFETLYFCFLQRPLQMCLICYFLPPLQWDPAESRSQSSSPERGGLVLCSALLCLHSHPGLWLPAAAEPLTASLLRSLWPRSGTEKYPPPLPPDTTVSLSLSLFGSVPSTPAVEKHYTEISAGPQGQLQSSQTKSLNAVLQLSQSELTACSCVEHEMRVKCSDQIFDNLL